MAVRRESNSVRGRTRETTVEVVTPTGMTVFVGLYLIGAALSILIGPWAFLQGVYERAYDMQILLLIQACMITTIGIFMLLLAMGIANAVKWALTAAKRLSMFFPIAGVFVLVTAIVGIYNLRGTSYAQLMFSVILWSAVFCIAAGVGGVIYFYSPDRQGSIRQWTELTSTEVFAPQNRSSLLQMKVRRPRVRTESDRIQTPRFCSNCGTELDGLEICPNCGTRRGA